MTEILIWILEILEIWEKIYLPPIFEHLIIIITPMWTNVKLQTDRTHSNSVQRNSTHLERYFVHSPPPAMPTTTATLCVIGSANATAWLSFGAAAVILIIWSLDNTLRCYPTTAADAAPYIMQCAAYTQAHWKCVACGMWQADAVALVLEHCVAASVVQQLRHCGGSM